MDSNGSKRQPWSESKRILPAIFVLVVAVCSANACASARAPARSAPPAAAHRRAGDPAPEPRAPVPPPIDIHAEPWRDPAEPEPRASERTPDPADPVSVLDTWPVRFQRQPPRGFAFGFNLSSRVRVQVRSKHWKEEVRTRCHDDSGFPASRALVTDESGKIRALTEASGTDDSAGTAQLYYDEQERLRLLFLTEAHYTGAQVQELVAFDATGSVSACDNLVLKLGSSGTVFPNVCAKPEPENDDSDLDPAVRNAVTAKPRDQTEKLDPQLSYFLAWKPREAFDACLPETAP